MITVEVQLQLPSKLPATLAAIRGSAMRQALNVAADTLMQDCARNFDRGGYESSAGNFQKWKALSPITLQISRLRGHPTHPLILVETGLLRSSILGGRYHVRRYEGTNTIVVGTSVPYASVHEKGATVTVTQRMRTYLGLAFGIWLRVGTVLRIPARPFLRPSRAGIQKAVREMANIFKRILTR